MTMPSVLVKAMKATGVFLLFCMGLTLAEDRMRYDGYKVYQVTPKTVEEAEVLMKLQDNPSFDFWAAPRALNVPVTVMVSPDAQNDFENDLNLKKVDFSILIQNLESKVQEETLRQNLSPRGARAAVSFTRYMRYTEITDYLEALARNFPNLVTIVNLGTSYEGRDILGVRISRGGANNPTIFVDAGIHAREWIAPPTALYIINQLVENPGNAALSRNVDWVIVPVLNPDGYEYTHTNVRLWRKTRTPGILCYGVDPNRNFDYYWMLTGASSNPCSEVYAGPNAFSESETSALRDYLLANRDTIKLYLTFHSYGQYLLYPWGYTSALPDNNDELYALGVDVDEAISSVAGTRYEIGSSTNVLYAAAGGSDDYAKGVAGIELSYTIELPGGGSSGFDPVATRILPIVQETWEGVKAYQDYIERKFVQ